MTAMSEGIAASMRFSTDELPPQDRLAILREAFGHQIAKIDCQPIYGHELSLTMTMRAIPGASLIVSTSSGLRGDVMTDSSDDISLTINTGAKEPALASQFGREETPIGPRAGVLLSHSDPGYLRTPTLTHAMVIRFPRNVMSLVIDGLEDMLGLQLPPSDALRLLTSYIAALDDLTLTSPDMFQTIGMHVHDLVSLVLGAGRDQAEIATRRGLAAARLVAIKKLIKQRLAEPDLNPTRVATAVGISVRQLHLLFEPTGTTFSQHLMRSRLTLSRRVLLEPASRHRTIADIAFACGFHNLTTFYTAFRQAFDATPDELRKTQIVHSWPTTRF